MNKCKLFLLAALIAVSASSVKAQKAGYINMDQMISLMPELGRIDTLLQKYQADSINTEFENVVRDYKYRDSILRSPDTLKMPKNVITQHRQELEKDAYQVQNWQQISQQAIQAKQQELLGPVYQRVYKALNDVAKENGYAFVYREEALLVAPQGDNLIPLVAKKLNLKLPTGPAAQGGGAAPNNPRPTANNTKPANAKPKQ